MADHLRRRRTKSLAFNVGSLALAFLSGVLLLPIDRNSLQLTWPEVDTEKALRWHKSAPTSIFVVMIETFQGSTVLIEAYPAFRVIRGADLAADSRVNAETVARALAETAGSLGGANS